MTDRQGGDRAPDDEGHPDEGGASGPAGDQRSADGRANRTVPDGRSPPDRGARSDRDRPTVVHVRPAEGPVLDPEGVAVDRVTGVEGALSVLPAADCVVCEQTGDAATGLQALRAVREAYPAVPTVLCTSAPDGEVASEATRLGVTEYVPRSGDRPVTERVRVVAAGGRERDRSAGDPTPANGPATARSRAVDLVESVDDTVFSLDADGRFAFVGAGVVDVFDADADLLGRRAETVLSGTLGRAVLAAVDRAREAGGSVTFTQRHDRTDQWVDVRVVTSGDGVAVSLRDVTRRRRHERAVNGLAAGARDLLAADDRQTVADLVAEAATDSLGFDAGRVLLDEGDLVYAAAVGDGVEATTVSPAVERAHRTGRTLSNPREAPALVVPLDDHGVLRLDAEDGAVQSDLAAAELLATNAAAALDRADRRETLERYESIIETVQGMVYVLDGDGVVEFVTEPLADWLGYDRAALVGEHAGVVVDGDGLERGRRAVRDLLTGEGSRTYRTELRGSEGDRLPAEVEVSLLDADAVRTVGVVRDRGELRAARRRLAAERDRLGSLFDGLQEPAVEVRYEGDQPVVEAANAVFRERFVGDDDPVGEPLSRYVRSPRVAPEDDADPLYGREGDVVDAERRLATVDGPREFLLRATRYVTDGDHRAFGVYTDVTERRRRERRLSVLHRVLRHNIRNRMTVVRGYANVLDEELEDHDHQDALDELLEAAGAVTSLGHRAREAERAMRGGGGPVDAATVVADIVADHRSAYPAATLTTDLPDSLLVDADDSLTIAVSNLVENAVVHDDGDPRVQVTGHRTGEGTVELRVSDGCPPIPDQERVVLDRERPPDQLDHGSGLGLWIVRWVVEAAGGAVSVEDDDRGNTVVVELPAAD
jgi:PAS domain S-box-containing protein